jgi:amino acid adenylation domain-containing protein
VDILDPYELLEQRLDAAEHATAHTIERVADDRPAPLSFAQERLWFLNQYLTDPRIYHIPVALRLPGRLDIPALGHALDDVIQRHETLRTRFETTPDGPRQVVMTVSPLDLAARDLSPTEQSIADQSILAAIHAELDRPMDLVAGPPMRVALLRVAPEDHVLVLVVHHIAFDAQSLDLIQRELAALYAGYANGSPAHLAPPPIRYRDYAAWQRAELSDPAAAVAHWRERLAGLAVLDLPVDVPAPANPRFGGEQLTAEIPADVMARLRQLAREAKTTVYAVLVAAFDVVLARHTGLEDIAIGVPASLRDRPELEHVVGVFLNMLVLRCDLSGRPTFRTVVARVREALLDAYAHQDLPFEKLVEELKPERSTSRVPFFDAVVNVLPPSRPGRFGELRCTPVEVPDRYSGYAVTLYLEEGDAARLHLVYQTERFGRERMRHLLEQLVALLDRSSAAPDTDCYGYSLVTDSARDLLPDPTQPLELPTYPPVTGTIAAAAERTPDAPAIRYGTRFWTYRQLVTAVDELAARLRATGHRPGDVVAIVGEPSFGYIAAFLAVFAARLVALPMDREVPVARQRELLSVGAAQRLLLVGELGPAAELSERAEVPVNRIAADGGTDDLPAPAAGVVGSDPVSPGDAAYIYFTSGTSGTPKGILGQHNTLSHLITWERETFEIGPGDRCGLTTRLLFDMVLRDIFTTLTSGATLCIPPDETLILDPPAALRWLAEERITFLHIVPTLAARWLERVPPDAQLPDMRWVYFAGEPLTEQLVRGWREAFAPGGGTAVNYYGTTETMVRTYHVVPPEPSPGVQSVGIPLPHCQTVLVNPDGLLCGIDEVGDVLLRSRIYTRGYLNAPDEQRIRFAPNPFRENDPPDVGYVTGDVGRYLPDGTVEVFGRVDDQVKINGVRIEPAEVQAAVCRHPDVASAVVVTRERDGQPTLVGYVVPRADAGITTSALRGYLRQRLPEVMIPGAFVTLAELPALPNGKVDKKSLPPPRISRDDDDVADLRTDLERTLAETWAQTLGVDRVGRYDNFFDLGGHSLKVVDAVARIRDKLGVEVPLRLMFEQPTLSGLAEAVDRLRTESVPEADLDALIGEEDVDAIIAALEELEREENR